MTLIPGDGYQVQFVNTTNQTQVFASSSDFTVKPNGCKSPFPSLSPSSRRVVGMSLTPVPLQLNLLTREDTPSDCIAATLMNVSAEAVLDIYQRYIRGVSLAFLTATFAAK